jgi:hypothetical protein
MLRVFDAYKDFKFHEQRLIKTINNANLETVKQLRNYVFSLYNNEDFLSGRNVISMSTKKDLVLKDNVLYVVLDLVIKATPKEEIKDNNGYKKTRPFKEHMEFYVEITQEIIDGAFGA